MSADSHLGRTLASNCASGTIMTGTWTTRVPRRGSSIDEISDGLPLRWATRSEPKEETMAQEVVLRDGYYECPECRTVFKITNPKPEDGDGYCDECEGDDRQPVRLHYLGPEPPDGCHW
jgi:hypothetical protein